MFNACTMFMPKTWCAPRNCWFMFAKETEGLSNEKKINEETSCMFTGHNYVSEYHGHP